MELKPVKFVGVLKVVDMNIIFLDIDGVLNSIDSALAFRNDEHLFLLNRKESLDPVSVGLLQHLCEETDAKIVISSTWRHLFTIDEFKGIFASYGWEDFPITGCTTTDRIHPSSSKRGYEIQHWLNNNAWKNYIILDDDSDMLDEQSEQFIHISNIHGFRSTHYCKALRIFGKPDDTLESQVNWKKHEI